MAKSSAGDEEWREALLMVKRIQKLGVKSVRRKRVCTKKRKLIMQTSVSRLET